MIIGIAEHRSDIGLQMALWKRLATEFPKNFWVEWVGVPGDYRHSELTELPGRRRRSSMMHFEPDDVVLVFGDRWRQLQMAMLAKRQGARVIHLHAGEFAQGIHDDRIRWAMTWLADVACCPHEVARERVESLVGQWRTDLQAYHTGTPALTGLDEVQPDGPGGTILAFNETREDLYPFIRRLHGMSNYGMLPRPVHFVSPGEYSDVGQGMEAHLESFATRICHQPRNRWLRTLKAANLLVGNSSMVCLEGPALGVRTVLVGRRQTGRLVTAQPIGYVINPTHMERVIATRLNDTTPRQVWDDYPAGLCFEDVVMKIVKRLV